MKVMVVIPMLILTCVGFAALLLKSAGVHVNPIDPAMAAVIAATAAMVGILPILRSRQTDAVAVVQLALIGTILHMFCTGLLTCVVIATRLEDLRGPFVFWLLAAYWISLAILVSQLRRVLLDMTPTPKVQN